MQSKKQKYTVLLLSAPIGSGHKLAAEAIEQELVSNYKQVNVIHGNIFDFFPHFLGKGFLKFYLCILQCCPWLYKIAYQWGNNPHGSLWLRSLINRILAFLGNSYLQKINPDAVIATHATPAGIIAHYKKSHPNLWLGAVITDFTIHRWWLCDGVDTYFIADEYLKNKLKVNAEIKAYGIPLRQDFLNNDRIHYRQSLNWSLQDNVCLLMGGGEGLLPMKKIIETLLSLNDKNLKIVAVTGHNQHLATTLHETYGNKIEVYGFRNDIPQLMCAADMIITKAGGLTSAEVLASDLSFIIYNPLPGQEEGNALFLQKYCNAFIANNLTVLKNYIKNYNKQNINYIERQKHAHPWASKDICQYLLQKLDSL